ncbi:MAG TPA: type II CAAX endopeptidase family protein [Pyrinomonadaceae bacterium]|nr:type II CAAX endopeptidase family protein [Pyrinomonadaceae bacterium]
MSLRDFRSRTSRFFLGSRLLAVIEIFLALLIPVGGLVGIIPFSSTPFLLLFGWLMLWLRGIGWRDLGLRRPASWPWTLVMGVAIGIAYQYLSLYVVEPLIARLTGNLPDVSQFAPLIGNKFFLFISIVISWTLAAFGEELAFRGYLMNRIADLVGSSPRGWAISVTLVSALFGIVHLYQGASGMIAITLTGLLLGGLYLATGRNLWLPIIVHGVNDTLGFLLIFLGKYPGL